MNNRKYKIIMTDCYLENYTAIKVEECNKQLENKEKISFSEDEYGNPVILTEYITEEFNAKLDNKEIDVKNMDMKNVSIIIDYTLYRNSIQGILSLLRSSELLLQQYDVLIPIEGPYGKEKLNLKINLIEINDRKFLKEIEKNNDKNIEIEFKNFLQMEYVCNLLLDIFSFLKNNDIKEFDNIPKKFDIDNMALFNVDINII